jgi:hypothetical protein
MGIFKQIAFYVGMVAGVATVGAAAAVLLTYLFTGKLPAVQMQEGDKAKMQLMTPDELIALFREQAKKAEAAVDVPLTSGGQTR